MGNHLITLTKESWLSWPETHTLIEIFTAAEKEIRFVGGAVRDLLISKQVHDVDVATTASPQQVLGILQKADVRAIPTGLSHGTITAIIGEVSFEITTLRSDIKTFGRHAEVQFTDDWRQDSERRDFTINGLYCDVDGRVYDYHQGLEDLRHRRVRFIGDASKRISEDALRILRFFRFTAYYSENEIDGEGLAACHQHREMLQNLSGERIANEMFLLLNAPSAPDILDLMKEQQLTQFIFGYAINTRSLLTWRKIALLIDEPESQFALPIPMIILALLCRSQKGAMDDFIISRWKLSNADADFLRYLTHAPAINHDVSEHKQKQILRQIGAAKFRALAVISWTEHLAQASAQSKLLAAAYRPIIWLAEHWEIPQFPLSGGDLAALGLPAGPTMGAWLKQLEEWWEREGYSPSKEDILNRFKSQR